MEITVSAHACWCMIFTSHLTSHNCAPLHSISSIPIPTPGVWHVQSGYFTYEVNLEAMTQRNTTSGKVRHIRRQAPNQTLDPIKPPLALQAGATANNSCSSGGGGGGSKKKSKKHKASWLTSSTSSSSSSSSTPPAAKKLKDSNDPLQLSALFGDGHGPNWLPVIRKALKLTASDPMEFIGPKRDKAIMPVRELTFQALKSHQPADWRVMVIGQNPYPRVESATGIAMFDALLKTWECSQFGKAVSMRCIVKAAAMAKHSIPVTTPVADLRSKLAAWDTVAPPEWFSSMLTQGVLLLNAALTIGGPFTTANHNKFWKPVIAAIVREILQAKQNLPDDAEHASQKHLVMLWWGGQSLKTKKWLKSLFAEFDGFGVTIHHVDHCNPAAQGDLFCKGKPHFKTVNKLLQTKAQQEPIDWLPTKQWFAQHGSASDTEFIAETQELHQMYLERMQAGLQTKMAKLEPITGVMAMKKEELPVACSDLGLKGAAATAVKAVQSVKAEGLSKHEKGAIYLYTGNSLYRRVNAALRDADRSKVTPYKAYLRQFLDAFDKLPGHEGKLFRGINKDLRSEYKQGSTVTWWSVSSCTPNIGVAQMFGGGLPSGTLFVVEAKTAVPIMDLSAFKSEEEYVLAPGTQLRVVSVTKKPGQAAVITLREIEGQRQVS